VQFSVLTAAVPLDPSKKFKEKNQQQPLDVIESSDEEKTPKKRTRSEVNQTSAESSATEVIHSLLCLL